MKHIEIIEELNQLLDDATACQRKMAKQRTHIVGQFQAEKQVLRKKLKSAEGKNNRKKLKRELNQVKDGLRKLTVH